MKQYTVYLEDDLDVKVSEYKKVKRNKNTSQVIREILYDFFDNIADKSANSRPTAPARDPNIEWMELEIPRCIKTRAQWNCWIGVKKDENLNWKVNGENRQWIIPDEPEGLLDE